MKFLQSLSRIKASFLVGVTILKGDLSNTELPVIFDDEESITHAMTLDEEETPSLEEINDELDAANNELDEMIEAGNKARR